MPDATLSRAPTLENQLAVERVKCDTLLRAFVALRDGMQRLEKQKRERGLVLCPTEKQPHEGWPLQESTERVLGAALLQTADELHALLETTPTPTGDQP